MPRTTSTGIFEDEAEDDIQQENEPTDADSVAIIENPAENGRKSRSRSRKATKMASKKVQEDPKVEKDVSEKPKDEDQPAPEKQQKDKRRGQNKVDYDLDFGPANYSQGVRGGKSILVESVKHPGQTFKFREARNADGISVYGCYECLELRRKKIVALPIPYLYVKNDRFVGRDPNNLPVEHFCIDYAAKTDALMPPPKLVEEATTSTAVSTSRPKRSSTNDTMNKMAISMMSSTSPRRRMAKKEEPKEDPKKVNSEEGRKDDGKLEGDRAKMPEVNLKTAETKEDEKTKASEQVDKPKRRKNPPKLSKDHEKIRKQADVEPDPELPEAVPMQDPLKSAMDKYLGEPTKAEKPQQSEKLEKRVRISAEEKRTKDFGEVELIETKRGAKMVFWPSQRYPGVTHEFLVLTKNTNGNMSARCKKCNALKQLYKKNNIKIPHMVPHTFIRDGRMCGRDPDSDEHFCVEGTTNYPTGLEKIETIRPSSETTSSAARPTSIATSTASTSVKARTPSPKPTSSKAMALEQEEDEEEDAKNTSKDTEMTEEQLVTQLDEYDTMMEQNLMSTLITPPKQRAFLPSPTTTPKKSQKDASQEILYYDIDQPENDAQDEPKPSDDPEEPIEDFGLANMIHEPRGSYILYDSRAYPGHSFKFRLYGYRKGVPYYYKCAECSKLRDTDGLKKKKIPVILLVDGRLVERDPDCPDGVEHFCLPGAMEELEMEKRSTTSAATKTSTKKEGDQSSGLGTSKEPSKEPTPTEEAKENEDDFGQAIFEKGDFGKDHLVYESKKIPGHQFKFFNMGGALRQMYKCAGCTKIKKEKGLECKVATVTVANGRIVGVDPDCPKNPHFCVKKTKGPKFFKKFDQEAPSPILPIKRENDDFEITPFKKQKIEGPLHSTPIAARDPPVRQLRNEDAQTANLAFDMSTEHYPLVEYSNLSRKVQFPTEYAIPTKKILLPCADRPVPIRKKYPLVVFPKGEEMVKAQKMLKHQFDAATTRLNNGADKLMLVDSLFYALDETVLKNTAIVRGDFPVQPRWILPHIQILISMLHAQSLPMLVYALGYDWLVHSEHKETSKITNLIMEEIEEIVGFLSKNRDKQPKIVFVTIPEIGDLKEMFSEFNREMRAQLSDMSRQLDPGILEILDWANLVEQASPNDKKNVDRRFKLLFKNE